MPDDLTRLTISEAAALLRWMAEDHFTFLGYQRYDLITDAAVEYLAKAAPERLEQMRDELRCPPEWMLRTLEHVEQTWGGVDSYLEAAGVTPENIDRLRAKLS